MAQIGSGEVKMKLYNMFKGRLETDIVDMVYAGCDYKGILLRVSSYRKLLRHFIRLRNRYHKQEI